ncbi:MAG: cytidine deaminase [Campylobacteraceae bacterium]|nr:cytidine deaminase [Campylobacteraceae bacterium]
MKLTHQELLKKAHAQKEHAYAPYSHFHVGAVLLMKDGKTIGGCNMENAAYGSTICAERVAIGSAVSQGYKPGDIEAIAIASSGENFSPCGACRQVISEFGHDIKVIFEWNGTVVNSTIKELLNYTFVLEKA